MQDEAVRPHDPAPARRHGGAQSGYTLLEVLIAVVLAGLVVLSLAAGMLTVVRVSAQTSERQTADAAMSSFAESVRAAPYLRCDDPARPGNVATYQDDYDVWAEAWQPRPGMTARIVAVEHWNGTNRYVAACPGTDRGAQRLTLEVTWGDQERRSHVVKRQR